MFEIQPTLRARFEPLFTQYEDALAAVCLEGRAGRLWADDADNPKFAVLETASFTFLGGSADEAEAAGARAFLETLHDTTGYEALHFMIRDEKWQALIRGAFAGREDCTLYPYKRWEMAKDASAFDRRRLEKFAETPAGYEIVPMDERWFEAAKKPGWVGGQPGIYATYADFAARAAGYVALCGGEEIGAAVTFADSREFAEVDLKIAEAHRRKGLATACCARLILDCLNRGVCPSWDAANETSVKLAEKLGFLVAYTFPCDCVVKARAKA